MKKLIFVVPFLCSVILAQSPPNPESRVAGRFVAYNYGVWSLPVYSFPSGTGSKTFTLTNPTVRLPDGRVIMPFSTTAPIYVGTEVVTPTAVGSGCVANSPIIGGCSITATFTFAHTNADPVRSGTFGLQEALNDAGISGGGAVTVDSAWASAGGTTGIINAATLPANTGIEDARAGLPRGSTTAALTMNNGGSGAASGTTFDGSVARTISYNTIGAQPANLAATAPGDMICGLHADTSAGSQTITAGSTTGTVATLTAASVPTYFYQGQLVGVTGATPSGLNGGPYTLTAVTNGTSGHISFANASTVWTSGGTFFLWAANQVTDGNAGYTAFSNSITMAANTWGVSLNALGITEQYTVFSSSSAATVQLGLAYGGVQLYNSATALTVGNSDAGYTGWHKIALGALSPSLMMITPGPASFVTTLAADVPGGTANPFTVDTTTTKALTPLVKFSNNTANNCLLLNDILIF